MVRVGGKGQRPKGPEEGAGGGTRGRHCVQREFLSLYCVFVRRSQRAYLILSSLCCFAAAVPLISEAPGPNDSQTDVSKVQPIPSTRPIPPSDGHGVPSHLDPATRALFNNSAPLGSGGGGGAPPPPSAKDLAKFFSRPLANQNFSLVPSAPIRLDQNFSSAPLKTQHPLGGGGCLPPLPPGPPPPFKRSPACNRCRGSSNRHQVLSNHFRVAIYVGPNALGPWVPPTPFILPCPPSHTPCVTTA